MLLSRYICTKHTPSCGSTHGATKGASTRGCEEMRHLVRQANGQQLQVRGVEKRRKDDTHVFFVKCTFII